MSNYPLTSIPLYGALLLIQDAIGPVLKSRYRPEDTVRKDLYPHLILEFVYIIYPCIVVLRKIPVHSPDGLFGDCFRLYTNVVLYLQ